MPWPLGDPDTFATCRYTLIFLPPEVALVKATLSIQMPDGQHHSECNNMLGVGQINGLAILSRKPTSVMPFVFGPE